MAAKYLYGIIFLAFILSDRLRFALQWMPGIFLGLFYGVLGTLMKFLAKRNYDAIYSKFDEEIANLVWTIWRLKWIPAAFLMICFNSYEINPEQMTKVPYNNIHAFRFAIVALYTNNGKEKTLNKYYFYYCIMHYWT